MILDQFDFQNVTVQIRFPHAFEIWDHAGAISRELKRIWVDLEPVEGEPNRQTLKAKGVAVQTAIDTAVVTMSHAKTFDTRMMQQIRDVYRIWCEKLNLKELNRVSARMNYVLPFKTLREANQFLLAKGLVKWPDDKVFDQPPDGEKNAIDVAFRFEDLESFAVLRLRTEAPTYSVKLDTTFTDEEEIKREKFQAVIDFDRGSVATIDAASLRMEDWLKGYVHVFRRDIEKIVK